MAKFYISQWRLFQAGACKQARLRFAKTFNLIYDPYDRNKIFINASMLRTAHEANLNLFWIPTLLLGRRRINMSNFIRLREALSTKQYHKVIKILETKVKPLQT